MGREVQCSMSNMWCVVLWFGALWYTAYIVGAMVYCDMIWYYVARFSM
ncbi:unnamed protein product [Onchocerca flexuosa]|uniref:Transmembrane protein n=1 Tax=Onchocerca flexuosa TaxID=387005 RepID=A0A183HG72_9BILA|nr:unnamed protein product [Onchocerca flexuosa]